MSIIYFMPFPLWSMVRLAIGLFSFLNTMHTESKGIKRLATLHTGLAKASTGDGNFTAHQKRGWEHRYLSADTFQHPALSSFK